MAIGKLRIEYKVQQ